jgi:hypothetical protein
LFGLRNFRPDFGAIFWIFEESDQKKIKNLSPISILLDSEWSGKPRKHVVKITFFFAMAGLCDGGRLPNLMGKMEEDGTGCDEVKS